MERIRMRHPSLPGREITVRPRAVPIHQASGWQIVEPEPKPRRRPAQQQQDQPEQEE